MIKSLVMNSTHPLSRRLDNSLSYHEKQPNLMSYHEAVGKGLIGEFEGIEMKLGSESFVGVSSSPEKTPKDNSSNVYVSKNGEILGFFRIRNQYRSGLKEIINNIGNKYQLSVLTGDHETEKRNLEHFFPSKAVMKFRQSPQDKLEYIESLQREGRKVLMVGDGLNDAGALKQSEVGLTLTEDITNFSPASDGIMRADRLTSLPGYLKFASTSRKIIIMAFVISFLYNAIGIGFAMSGLLTPLVAAILMPLSSVSVVAFCVLSTNFLARLKKLN
jgi:Cu+-exporting ATPase